MSDTQEIDAGALRARLAETPTADEVGYLDALLARQHAILTGVADALRGDPGPLASHSHHDLAERAAAMVALLAVTQASLEAASSGRRVTACDEIERLQREIAMLRAAYAQHEPRHCASDHHRRIWLYARRAAVSAYACVCVCVCVCVRARVWGGGGGGWGSLSRCHSLRFSLSLSLSPCTPLNLSASRAFSLSRSPTRAPQDSLTS